MNKQLEFSFMNNSKKYSDEDLMMFKNIIENKLARALEVLSEQKDIMKGTGGNGTYNTSWQFRQDDAPEYSNKHEASLLAHKQEVFIESLQSALVRIEAKTYGICIKTGELIDKNRLLAVPNTSTGIIIKNQLKKEEESTLPLDEPEL